MRDKRDVGVRPARHAKLTGNMVLELDKRVHVRPCCGEHVVAPEHHPHPERAVAQGALDELEAGAVIEGFINDRVPRDGDCPPAVLGPAEFFDDVVDLVNVHVLPVALQPLPPVKKAAVVIILKGGFGSLQEVAGVLLDKPLLELGVGAHHRFGERGIHLECDFFELDGCLLILRPEHPPLLKDHLYDEFVGPPDRRCPDQPHA